MSRWGTREKKVLKRRCALAGCSKTFVPRAGGRPQRFCCPAHKHTHHSRLRKGSRSRQSRRYDTCPHGHDRSPENTYIVVHRKRGQIEARCRVCENARKRERRAA